MDNEPTGFRPPYMSFQTFWNFLDELSEKPLPPRVDRSIMTSKSGTDQANLTLALTSFELTDTEGNVQPMLARLVELDKTQRAAALAPLIEAYYVGPLKVSAKNGTPADLNKAFADDYPSIASGDTRRKAVTFFLHAARTAGITLSAHFPATRSGQGAPGAAKTGKRATRKRSNNTADGSTNRPGETPAAPPQGHTYTVSLTNGGTVTLTYDVDLFEVTDKDERFVLDLVKKLRTYTGKSAPTEEGDGGQ